MNLVGSGCWRNFNLMSKKSSKTSSSKSTLDGKLIRTPKQSQSKIVTTATTTKSSPTSRLIKSNVNRDSVVMISGSGVNHRQLKSPSLPKSLSPSRRSQSVPILSLTKETNFERMFKFFDKNGDGFIDQNELMTMMKALGEPITKEEAVLMVKEADRNGDGKIDFKEFRDMLARTPPFSGTKFPLKEAFRVFDRDHDGFISLEEMKLTLIALGENASDAEYSRMFKIADKNSDGKISFDEFSQIVREKKK